MGAIGRYMFRTTMVAFLITLISLTVVHLVHAGDARLRPDHQPAADDVCLRRHHRPDRSPARHDDRADRLDDVVRARAQQTRLGFRDHRHECGGRFAMAAGPAFPGRRHRGFDPGRRHRGLHFAAQPARAARLGRAGARRHSHQHRPAGPLHHCQRQPHLPHRRPATERASRRHLRRRPARSEGARHLPRRAGRDRKERQRLVPRARRTAASSGWKPASAIRAS